MAGCKSCEYLGDKYKYMVDKHIEKKILVVNCLIGGYCPYKRAERRICLRRKKVSSNHEI